LRPTLAPQPLLGSASAVSAEGHLQRLEAGQTALHRVQNSPPLTASVNWFSYLGAAEAGEVRREVWAGDGTLVIAGSAQDLADPATVDMVVGKVARDGSEATFLFINPGGASGTTSTGQGLVVDAQGVIYVAGTTDVNGTPNMVAARVAPDLSGTDWVVTVDRPGAVDTGAAAALDATGDTLYLAGTFDETPTGGLAQNVGLVKFTDLTAAMPTLDRMASFHSTGGVASATDLIIDSQGRWDFSGTAEITGNVEPALWQIRSDLSGGAILYYPFLGRTNVMHALSLGQDGNYYATGQTEAQDVPYRLLVVKFPSSYIGGQQIFGSSFDSSNGAVWGEGVQADQAGFPYVAGTDGGTIMVIKLNTNGLSVRDGIDILGNGASDIGHALILDEANNAYVAGTATSTDLSTPGVFQPVYGGGARDGFVTQVSTFS
jgi:hypothetical protein